MLTLKFAVALIVEDAYSILVQANHQLNRAGGQHSFRRASRRVAGRVPQAFDVTTKRRPGNTP